MTKQWVADFHHGRRGQTMVHEVSRRCCECKKDSDPRWIYCSDECALASVQAEWKLKHPKDPLPERIATLDAYLADRDKISRISNAI